MAFTGRTPLPLEAYYPNCDSLYNWLSDRTLSDKIEPASANASKQPEGTLTHNICKAFIL